MRASASGLRSRAVAIAAALWLAAHLPFLAPSLEDIDSINFALGLREFNPALHQPHPPGYPVYIALGRTSLRVVSAIAPQMPRIQAEALALAVWPALAGALAIFGAARLFAQIDRRGPPEGGHYDSQGVASGFSRKSVATAAALLLAASPLFWLTGLRPMSDMLGLAIALWAQALLLEHRISERRWLAGAFLAGLAGGVRVQILPLTLPLLLLTMWERRGSRGQSHRAGVWAAVIAVVLGVLVWAVPLVLLSGGLMSYLAATRTQASEIVPVEMLLSDPTARRLAFALYETFVLPWASLPLAIAVGGAALVGLALSIRRQPLALGVALTAFAPYVVYHLLIQETITTRYALPVVPLVIWLAVSGVASLGRLSIAVAAGLTIACMVVAVPGGVAYGREAHPAFRAIDDARRAAATQQPAHSFAHYGLRRPLQAAAGPSLHLIEPPRSFEWLGVVSYWRNGGRAPVWFFADPKRTDLALIDPESRRDVTRYAWSAADRGELSGTRPLGVDWYRIGPPGWFVEEGWSLTPETGGIVQATATGPDRRPIEAWIRRRAQPMQIMVGGRHLGVAGDADAEFELAIDGVVKDRWRLSFADRNFLRFLDLPDGLPGDGDYATLTIAARAADGRPAVPVAVRQFDAQDASTLVVGFGEGWHEAEYTVQSGASWRWTSDRSVLLLRGAPQAVRLTLRGESPLKYVDDPPTVRVRAGDRVMGEFRPDDDFEWSVTVPASAWVASGGRLTVETDRIYLPGEAEGTSDERRLGLRLFETRVDPVAP